MQQTPGDIPDVSSHARKRENPRNECAVMITRGKMTGFCSGIMPKGEVTNQQPAQDAALAGNHPEKPRSC